MLLLAVAVVSTKECPNSGNGEMKNAFPSDVTAQCDATSNGTNICDDFVCI